MTDADASHQDQGHGAPVPGGEGTGVVRPLAPELNDWHAPAGWPGNLPYATSWEQVLIIAGAIKSTSVDRLCQVMVSMRRSNAHSNDSLYELMRLVERDWPEVAKRRERLLYLAASALIEFEACGGVVP